MKKRVFMTRREEVAGVTGMSKEEKLYALSMYGSRRRKEKQNEPDIVSRRVSVYSMPPPV